MAISSCALLRILCPMPSFEKPLLFEDRGWRKVATRKIL